MVAIIKQGKTLRRAFQYNDNKLKDGAASLLTTENFPLSITESNGYLALKMLEKVAELRQDTQVNCLHISLNFAPEERLSDDKMHRIAKDYMDQIGFGDQPYLVYRHNDSGHDHCHIVTTNITLDAERISLHNIGKLKSEPARIALEKKYGLIKAEEHKQELSSIVPVDARKVVYGKTVTKRAIGNVLAQVLEQYKFTSVAELNAILGLYNVRAEAGQEGSRLLRFGGLQYCVLDNYGDPIGTPIKASLFYNRPTKKYLEKLFVRNDVKRQEHKKRIQTVVSFLLKSKGPQSLSQLKDLLTKENIRLITRLNKDGVIYGLTYVDLKTKVVFNGSALGKQYSAKGLLSTIHLKDNLTGINSNVPPSLESLATYTGLKTGLAGEVSSTMLGRNPGEKSLLELLTQYEFVASSVPYEWRKKNKKKKRKRS